MTPFINSFASNFQRSVPGNGIGVSVFLSAFICVNLRFLFLKGDYESHTARWLEAAATEDVQVRPYRVSADVRRSASVTAIVEA